jgi:hypothetical protein
VLAKLAILFEIGSIPFQLTKKGDKKKAHLKKRCLREQTSSKKRL